MQRWHSYVSSESHLLSRASIANPAFIFPASKPEDGDQPLRLHHFTPFLSLRTITVKNFAQNDHPTRRELRRLVSFKVNYFQLRSATTRCTKIPYRPAMPTPFSIPHQQQHTLPSKFVSIIQNLRRRTHRHRQFDHNYCFSIAITT
mmetsp:Transcript_4579/g.6960  ORF Transcript_4579/g.6960 Transcript_4579/m.6960 type:complete len:146 (-) Transcript_4579:24-461(-)